jgi:hypothetical protein
MNWHMKLKINNLEKNEKVYNWIYNQFVTHKC